MDSLFATGNIALWLLVLGLFLPRLTLFIAAFLTGGYPANDLPDLIDVLGWLFLPRFLMAYYIYIDIGANTLWFWAYIVLGIVGLFGEGGFARSRYRRRD
jgi:hypothetical protein